MKSVISVKLRVKKVEIKQKKNRIFKNGNEMEEKQVSPSSVLQL
jgi:hypothetical protein